MQPSKKEGVEVESIAVDTRAHSYIDYTQKTQNPLILYLQKSGQKEYVLKAQYIRQIRKIIERNLSNAQSICILSRNNNFLFEDMAFWKKSVQFDCSSFLDHTSFDESSNEKSNKRVKVTFKNVHKSKGEQYDVVIVSDFLQ